MPNIPGAMIEAPLNEVVQVPMGERPLDASDDTLKILWGIAGSPAVGDGDLVCQLRRAAGLMRASRYSPVMVSQAQHVEQAASTLDQIYGALLAGPDLSASQQPADPDGTTPPPGEAIAQQV